MKTGRSANNFGSMLVGLDKLKIDRSSIPKALLNIDNKRRVSPFPWRGQFSPQLIEILLSHYHRKDEIMILDPFVGSGTVLLEAARLSLPCFGADVNPAACEMAKMAKLANIPIKERKKMFNTANDIIRRSFDKVDIFSQERSSQRKQSMGFIHSLLEKTKDLSEIHNIILNTLFLSNTANCENLVKRMPKSLDKIERLIMSLPFYRHPCEVYNCDARSIPLENSKIDLVITSPPYINVFNYHQNHRNIMELDGWNLLEIAKSEIGSNRKNRSNRFQTVIQYSLDMLLVLHELARIVKPNGRIVIIVGRESKIRGVSFENYLIIMALSHSLGLQLISRRERNFTGRFGTNVIEDILEFKLEDELVSPSQNQARAIAIHLLKQRLKTAKSNIALEIRSAIDLAYNISPSPVFSMDNNKVRMIQEDKNFDSTQ